MSVIAEEYFSLLLNKSSDYHGVQAYDSVNQEEHNQLKNRAALLFSLECVLYLHRQTYATVWNPLTGRDALDHLLLQKYKWPLSEIRSLSLKDTILLLLEELHRENLPDPVTEIIRHFGAGTKQQFQDLKDDEWDPDLYLTLPKQQNW